MGALLHSHLSQIRESCTTYWGQNRKTVDKRKVDICVFMKIKALLQERLCLLKDEIKHHSELGQRLPSDGEAEETVREISLRLHGLFDIWKFRVYYGECTRCWVLQVRQPRENRNNISMRPNILAPQFDYQKKSNDSNYRQIGTKLSLFESCLISLY